jgi:LPXTG-motif cell wall-anchored protein
MNYKRCPQCGKENPSEMNFCLDCGQLLEIGEKKQSIAADLPPTVFVPQPQSVVTQFKAPDTQFQAPNFPTQIIDSAPPSRREDPFLTNQPKTGKNNTFSFIVIGLSFAGAGILLIIWLAGIVFGIGGAIIHLLLLLAIFLGIIGAVTGVVYLARR